jgi:hypothetical protein
MLYCIYKKIELANKLDPYILSYLSTYIDQVLSDFNLKKNYKVSLASGLVGLETLPISASLWTGAWATVVNHKYDTNIFWHFIFGSFVSGPQI